MTGSPRALLSAHGLAPKSSFGQNFLADRNLAKKIAELSTPVLGGTVIEIGAGLGALTLELAPRASRVIAVERDRDLVPLLQKELESIELGHVEILEADAKAVDYARLFDGAAEPRVLAGNLPYHLTGPLLERTTGLSGVVDRAVFMVQLEVAERLAADPGDSEYGALTVFVRAAFRVERALVVRRGAFYPQPGVDSAVVVLTPANQVVRETDSFRAVVKGAFAQRRKTLRNAWKGLLGRSVAEIARAAETAGIDLDARGETLSVADFARVADALSEPPP